MATITEQKLKRFIKEGVREALAVELAKLRALALPDVSEKEQENIERLYRRPSRRTAKTITVNL